MTASEDKEQAKSHIIKEIIHLLSNKKVAQQLVDILSILKDESTTPKISKNISYMSKNTQNDQDHAHTF